VNNSGGLTLFFVNYSGGLTLFCDQEGELMENLFNCLCSLLLEKENRDRFLQGEGIQLMNLMLRLENQMIFPCLLKYVRCPNKYLNGTFGWCGSSISNPEANRSRFFDRMPEKFTAEKMHTLW
jgi:hypothetical protein